MQARMQESTRWMHCSRCSSSDGSSVGHSAARVVEAAAHTHASRRRTVQQRVNTCVAHCTSMRALRHSPCSVHTHCRARQYCAAQCANCSVVKSECTRNLQARGRMVTLQSVHRTHALAGANIACSLRAVERAISAAAARDFCLRPQAQ